MKAGVRETESILRGVIKDDCVSLGYEIMRRTLLASLLIGLLAPVFILEAGASPRMHFQSSAVLQGRVVDINGALVPRAQVSVRNNATGLSRKGETDSEGNYQIAALPVGNYRVEARADGFGTKIVEHLDIEVARIIVQDFRLEVGDITQTIDVASDTPLVETATVSVGQVISERTVQEIPLNGRYLTNGQLPDQRHYYQRSIG